MSKKNKGKGRVNVVYSTNPDFSYEHDESEEQETLDPRDQDLRVLIDRKQRGGKIATVITGFVGTEDDLKDLGKTLKQKCGVGGSAKDGEIIIQGDQREKIMGLLSNMGYRAKKSGG